MGLLLVVTVIASGLIPVFRELNTVEAWLSILDCWWSPCWLPHWGSGCVLGERLKGFLPAFVAILSCQSCVCCFRVSLRSNAPDSSFFFCFSVAPRIADPQYRGLPGVASPAVRSEYYIKIGLVLLGTSVLFGEILEAGFFGILQGIVVVFSVWYFTFWLARKMKVDEEMGVMLSSAVSICGVSAAIATCGAIKGRQ